MKTLRNFALLVLVVCGLAFLLVPQTTLADGPRDTKDHVLLQEPPTPPKDPPGAAARDQQGAWSWMPGNYIYEEYDGEYHYSVGFYNVKQGSIHWDHPYTYNVAYGGWYRVQRGDWRPRIDPRLYQLTRTELLVSMGWTNSIIQIWPTIRLRVYPERFYAWWWISD